MRILFLDDDENRHSYAMQALIGQNVTHVRTAPEAIAKLKAEAFDVAMLDHDLGGTHYAPSDEKSGYHVAKAIEEETVKVPGFVVVHSYNAAGATRMVQALSGHVSCGWLPFGPGAFAAVLGMEAKT